MSSTPNLNEVECHVSRNRNDVVYVHDLDGNFTFLNRAGELLLGYSHAEVRHLNIADVVAPEIAAHLWPQLSNALATPIGIVYEIEVISKQGKRMPFEVSMRVVSRQGQPVEIRGIAVPLLDPSRTTRRCLAADFLL